MFSPIPSFTDQMSLAQVTQRLAQHPAVSGIVWIGSTGTDTRTTHSDYDLLLFLEQLPLPLHVIFTTVDGALTDIVLATTDVLDQILETLDLSALSQEEGATMAWLRDGHIQYDGDGRVRQAQTRLREKSWQTTVPYHVRRSVWQKINYNVQQTRRMLHAGDPVYDVAVDLRLLYMVSELTVAYFQVRNVGYRGEKWAIRYWQEQDPAYLQLLQACMDMTDRAHQFALYEQLAERTLAPVGGLVTMPMTTFSFTGDAADWETAGRFWESLLQ